MEGGASSSTSAAATRRWTYEVFLSFRGEDTRKNFIDHLYKALNRVGINAFKDDKKLTKGESISPELIKAIEESMIAVVVFSKNYANSRWCLEELVNIIECRDLKGQRVLPVFYDVEPSDVRGQKGSFHSAFEEHEVKFIDDMEKLNRWREALKTAANLSGWDVFQTANGHEAECIELIVKNILGHTPSYPPEDLVGMESRIRDVKSLLAKGSGDCCMIGIWGMGGIGKTTIARAVYSQISSEFDGCSFLGNVRENSSDNRGLQSLQEKLLSEILEQKDFKVKDCYDGKCQIRRRLGRKKVLVVLDDVDNKKQLEFLATCDWFGPGSRIMITTRDKHVISDAQEEYTPKLLTQTQAMELFSRHAFKKNIPPNAYKEVAGVVVTRTGHLPLALKVLGSHFCGRKLDFWQSALKVLAKIPHKDITRILKISYDELNFLEQKIFLYIACFYNGENKRIVVTILDNLGFEPASGIVILIEKCLLSISKGHLYMHDVIQEMGRWIVREYHPNTMVWVQEKIKEVMTTSDKLETVEVIMEREGAGNHRYSPEVFKSMKKLMLLHIYGSFTSSEPTYFPEELKYLSWSLYPFQSLRLAEGMTNVVRLIMKQSNIKQLQIKNKVIFTNLKIMSLFGSSAFTSFPDISGVPNLEELLLTYCQSLVEVHRSVLFHKSIRVLNLDYCTSLKILPPSIQMESLQTLGLNGCKSLERFPEVTMEMGRLLWLDMHDCKQICPLPSSIRLFTGLIGFVIGQHRWTLQQSRTLMQEKAFIHFTWLRILDLKGNELKDDDFTTCMHNAWPSLEELYLCCNIFTRLPPCISQLSHLKYLNLSYCPNLVELPELPSLIQFLRADHCETLKKIGDMSNKCKWLFHISLHSCPKLLEDQESESNIAKLLIKSLVQKCAAVNHRLSITVPGSKIPNWFTNKQSGNKIVLNLPKKQINKIVGLAVCCLFSQSLHSIPRHIKIKFKASGEKTLFDITTTLAAAESSECVWIGYMSVDFLQNLCYGFEFEYFIISFEPDSTTDDIPCVGGIVECGTCVVYKDAIERMIETGSRITQYDEPKHAQDYEGAGDIHHAIYMSPTFSMDDGKTGDRNIVKVLV